MTDPTPTNLSRTAHSIARAAFARGTAFFLLWLTLMQSLKPADLAIGALSTVAATWVSLRLLSPEHGRLRIGVLITLIPHLLWESVVAAIDVARRSFSPSLPIDPGFVKCPLKFPPGFARNTFSSITSLLPGSVPAGDDDGVLVYHAIDITQPVVDQLCEEERRLARALVAGERHD